PAVGDSPEGVPFDPFTFAVQVVETPKPYQLAIAFADAVDANKATLKTDLSQLLIPSVGAAAQAAAATAQATAQGTTLSAVAAFVTSWQKAGEACALAKIQDSPGKMACKIAVDQARLDKGKADT